jgi:nitroreductase
LRLNHKGDFLVSPRDVKLEVTVQEAIRTLRSMRLLKSDPVEPEKVRAILKAASMAPSGGNSQPWEFVLITDGQIKRKLRELVVQGLETYAMSNLRIPKDAAPEFLSPTNPVVWLAQHTEKVPVLILACLNAKRARRLTEEWAWLEEQSNWASVFPAVQNLLLQARGLGLGTAISIFPLFRMAELKQLLQLPEYVKPGILVYVGYPATRFSEPKRQPIENFMHENKW